jgi:hypothetical protein
MSKPWWATQSGRDEIRRIVRRQPLYMPHDLVVVQNKDADEAGDYRVMRHDEAHSNPQWRIMHNMKPEDLE